MSVNIIWNSIFFIGLICCCVGVLFFASPLTVLAQVIRTKNTESLPFPIIIASFFVSLQWFFYGMLIEDSFIQVGDIILHLMERNDKHFYFRYQIYWDASCHRFSYCCTQFIQIENCILMVDQRINHYDPMPTSFENVQQILICFGDMWLATFALPL